jgi:glycosyltransferase involved in cell wall biosynthesis
MRVTFVFAARAIGGAERSMLRLIEQTHPERLACRIVLVAPENPELRHAAGALGVPFERVAAWNLPGLWTLLRRHRPEVLYVFGRFRTIAWALVARVAGVRRGVAAERSAANRASDRWARRLDRRLVDAYVANSEFAAERVRGVVGPDGPPVHVVPNGIAGGQAVERIPGDGPPTIVCIGNISANKGQGVLLEAVRVLRARHPELRAVLVGRDFTKGRFFAQADARGLGDTYEATGFVADVSPYLARATVVALPTLGREGMPTSLLEAMRAGVPVVASHVGGVGEIVRHEHTGLLVEPGDAPGLAEALGRLLDDVEERTRLGAAGQRIVRERHDVSVMVEGHVAAFASVGGGRVESRVHVAHVTTADVSLRYLLLNQLHAIREDGYGITGVSSHGPDVARLREEGIEHAAVPMSRRLTPWRDLVSLVRLYRLMRRRRFTIVHTHNPKPGLLGQLAARLAGVPVVVNTLHGFYFHDRMRPLARRFFVAMEKLAARCSDVILSQNDEDVRTALELGIARPGQIRHLGNGIDIRRFDPARLTPEDRRRTRATLGIAADAPVVGFVGRLVAEKGVPELLAAARLVADAIPAVRFVLIGGTDSEKADALSPRIAEDMGVAGVCLFAGVREDMPEMYQAMDVFALPSHREGFPRAPLEASAMEVPCVVTDVRGCRQAVAHERNGLLVPPGDAPALARALVDLLGDPVHARRLGEEGRRRALELFDERRVFARVLAEYDRLLREKGVRGDEEPVRFGPAVPPAPAGVTHAWRGRSTEMRTARWDEEPNPRRFARLV